LEQFSNELEKLGLYEVVQAASHGIEVSVPNFYSIFKLYCPSIRIFFTPITELSLSLFMPRFSKYTKMTYDESWQRLYVRKIPNIYTLSLK